MDMCLLFLSSSFKQQGSFCVLFYIYIYFDVNLTIVFSGMTIDIKKCDEA